MVIVAIIPGLIANHIKEYTIQGKTFQGLAEDFKSILLLVPTIYACVHLVVVIHILSPDIHIKPVGVFISHFFIQLAEVETSHHPNPRIM